jgi:high-affinity iron transporter
MLRADPANAAYADMQLWDALAAGYASAVSDDSIARGARLYARDCAACHGERGDGSGVAGRDLPGLTVMHPEMPRGPANFTDASQMLGASDALLQGKVLRGGMGTGMPEWGSLYDDAELWNVVAFLRTFTLDLDIPTPP